MNLNNIKALFYKWGKEEPIFRDGGRKE